MRTWERDIHRPGGYAARFVDFWHATLRSGVLELEPPASRAAFNAQAAAALLASHKPAQASGLTLAAFTMPSVGDGRHANNPWLLELPDPVSKVCWDNFVAMAPSTAAELGLREGDIVEVSANGATVEAPVRRHPGAHKGVLSVGIGWGRAAGGSVADGEGFNAYALGATAGGRVVYSGGAVELKKTGKRTDLADVQGHDYMKVNPSNDWEADRAIVQVTNLSYYNESDDAPQAVHHIPGWEPGQPKPDLWYRNPADGFDKSKSEHQYPKHKWVMAIDLNACNGCNACMVACQAENNIPVVGKREVLVGREMHWIRIDRYFKGTPDDPEAAKLPMLCQHCDNAPCETVCPVLATIHSDEGLNVQAYNRCAGTRYCANNCPYKVRRFNFYQYSSFRKGPHENQKIKDTPLVLQLNPDHTVRTKGIMEKCTFCHQRIRDAKYDAKKKGRNIAEGELKTACQQTCPAQAIYFGDERNPDHQVNKVRKAHKYKRGYGVLEELNVQPSILYLAQIKNRDPREDDVAFHKVAHHGGGHGDDHGGDHGGGEESHSANPAQTEQGAPA
jgi:molybdopterin-containing oxidoreductase family iron-sulfur binding subunit